MRSSHSGAPSSAKRASARRRAARASAFRFARRSIEPCARWVRPSSKGSTITACAASAASIEVRAPTRSPSWASTSARERAATAIADGTGIARACCSSRSARLVASVSSPVPTSASIAFDSVRVTGLGAADSRSFLEQGEQMIKGNSLLAGGEVEEAESQLAERRGSSGVPMARARRDARSPASTAASTFPRCASTSALDQAPHASASAAAELPAERLEARACASARCQFPARSSRSASHPRWTSR